MAVFGYARRPPSRSKFWGTKPDFAKKKYEKK